MRYRKAPAHENYEYPQWPNYDPNSLSYLKIGLNLLPDRGFQQAEANFWSRYLYDLYEVKTKRTIPLSTGDDTLRISTYSQQPSIATTVKNQNVGEIETFNSFVRPFDVVDPGVYGSTHGKLASNDPIIIPNQSDHHANLSSISHGASSFFDDVDRPLTRQMSQMSSNPSHSQLEQNRLKEQQVIISSFAYTMVGTSISLLIIVIILLIILYKQRKRQTFKTASPSVWLEASNSTGSHYFQYPPTTSSTTISTPEQGQQSSVRPSSMMLY